MGFLSFIVETYESRTTTRHNQSESDGNDEGVGRPSTQTSTYLDGHP